LINIRIIFYFIMIKFKNDIFNMDISRFQRCLGFTKLVASK
jgi:hypothetical protein